MQRKGLPCTSSDEIMGILSPLCAHLPFLYQTYPLLGYISCDSPFALFTKNPVRRFIRKQLPHNGNRISIHRSMTSRPGIDENDPVRITLRETSRIGIVSHARRRAPPDYPIFQAYWAAHRREKDRGRGVSKSTAMGSRHGTLSKDVDTTHLLKGQSRHTNRPTRIVDRLRRWHWSSGFAYLVWKRRRSGVGRCLDPECSSPTQENAISDQRHVRCNPADRCL